MLRAGAALLALAAALLPAPGWAQAVPDAPARLLVVVGEDEAVPGRAALRAAGAEPVRSAPSLAAVVVRADDATAARLAAADGVRYVEPLVRRTALQDAATPERAELALDEAAALLPGLDGRGTVVAVLDTGVDPANPDLLGRVEDGGDYTTGVRRPGGTVDANGHGTGVAALAAAAADGSGLVGAAPAAVVRSYKVLDADGSGGSLGLALAIRQVADDAAAGVPVAVANMSLGGPFRSRVETEALAYAARVAPQVLFVAASGNDGGSRPSFPAGFPGVLSVGASQQGADGAWRRAPFSTTADVDVLAPGADVLTYDYVPGRQAPVLGRVSGTSEAAPAVAGVVAGLAAGRGVRGQQAAALLKASAEPAALSPGAAAGDGSGRADALAAALLGDGLQGYSTAFAELGAQVEPGAVRALAVARFVPGGAQVAPADLAVEAGLLRGGVVATAPAATGTLVTQSWLFALPAGGAGAWRTRGPGGETGDDVPFEGLDLLQGEAGLPVRSGTGVRSALGRDGRAAALVSFSVQQGQAFTVSAAAPPEGGALLLWAPAQAGGRASSYDEPVEQVELAGGTATYRAPVTGRYVVGHLLAEGGRPGSYEVRVDHPEPAGRVSAPPVSTSATAGLAFPVSWGGAQRYDVQWMVRSRTSAGWVSGPWRTWLADTTRTSALFGAGGSPVEVAPGGTYHLRVVPYDGLGGVGAPSASVAVAVPLDDRAGALRYSAGWGAASGAERFRGTLRTASGRGASVVLTAEAASFSLVADRGPGHGQVDVLLDGVRVARVDTAAPALQRRAVVWRSGALPGGIRGRTLRVVAVGTPGRPRVALDAVAAHR